MCRACVTPCGEARKAVVVAEAGGGMRVRRGTRVERRVVGRRVRRKLQRRGVRVVKRGMEDSVFEFLY